MSNDEKKNLTFDDQVIAIIDKIKEQCKPGEIQGFHYLVILKNGDTVGDTIGKPGTESFMMGVQLTALMNLVMSAIGKQHMHELLSSIQKSFEEQFVKESTVH